MIECIKNMAKKSEIININKYVGMKENEAIEKLKCLRLFMEITDKTSDSKFSQDDYEANRMAIKALAEIQQYRAIGTVEECREAMEKQKTKKPRPIDYKKYIGVVENAKALRGLCWCPNCHQTVKSGSFCKNCGQKLDWGDEE